MFGDGPKRFPVQISGTIFFETINMVQPLRTPPALVQIEFIKLGMEVPLHLLNLGSPLPVEFGVSPLVESGERIPLPPGPCSSSSVRKPIALISVDFAVSKIPRSRGEVRRELFS